MMEKREPKCPSVSQNIQSRAETSKCKPKRQSESQNVKARAEMIKRKPKRPSTSRRVKAPAKTSKRKPTRQSVSQSSHPLHRSMIFQLQFPFRQWCIWSEHFGAFWDISGHFETIRKTFWGVWSIKTVFPVIPDHFQPLSAQWKKRETDHAGAHSTRKVPELFQHTKKNPRKLGLISKLGCTSRNVLAQAETSKR